MPNHRACRVPMEKWVNSLRPRAHLGKGEKLGNRVTEEENHGASESFAKFTRGLVENTFFFTSIERGRWQVVLSIKTEGRWSPCYRSADYEETPSAFCQTVTGCWRYVCVCVCFSHHGEFLFVDTLSVTVGVGGNEWKKIHIEEMFLFILILRVEPFQVMRLPLWNRVAVVFLSGQLFLLSFLSLFFFLFFPFHIFLFMFFFSFSPFLSLRFFHLFSFWLVFPSFPPSFLSPLHFTLFIVLFLTIVFHWYACPVTSLLITDKNKYLKTYLFEALTSFYALKEG